MCSPPCWTLPFLDVGIEIDWLVEWVRGGTGTINALLWKDVVSTTFKEVCNLSFKGDSSTPRIWTTTAYSSQNPIWGKVHEHVVTILSGGLGRNRLLRPIYVWILAWVWNRNSIDYSDGWSLLREWWGTVSLVILLDFSVVFDSISRGILWGWGVSVFLLLLHWLIPEDGAWKLLLSPIAFTLQGPISSILFNRVGDIYIKPLGEVNKGCGVRCHQYVNDTQLYFPLTAESDGSVDTLNMHLETVIRCIRADKLKLSTDKTETMLVSYKATRGLRSQSILKEQVCSLR